jgi:preprotein translocase subunit SecA
MLDRAETPRVNWLLAVGDFDILREASDPGAVFWHRVRQSPVRVGLIVGVGLLAVALIAAAFAGPARFGLQMTPADLAPWATAAGMLWALLVGYFVMKWLPSRNDRVVLSMRKWIQSEIDPLDAAIRALSDEQLRAKTEEFRQRLKNGENLEDLRAEAYACVREASRRARNHRQYECQLIGARVIESNNVAEMRTGEGKTIVCYCANYLKVLQGLKVHMVTVNDYLVRRDAEFCRPIFELLGVSVGFITAAMPVWGAGVEERRAAYECDITYGTNSEFGFDYLRDNMKLSRREQMQGKQDFAVVDEVDSILIDEARTPLIISGPAHDDVGNYKIADQVARKLIQKQKQVNQEFAARIDAIERDAPKEQRQHPKFRDGIKKFRTDPLWLASDEAEAIGHLQYFVVEMDRKSAHMTEHGAKFAQQELGIGSFYDNKNMNWPHYIDNAVRAHLCYQRDKEYVVQDGVVVIVDEFTGRLMTGRQWSDGLHQAVEAKEGVQIKQETQTLATITLQNLFKMYKQLAGMTGTAMTEADEFMKIYKLEVTAIPTNRPIRRIDYNDKIYKTLESKFDAIVDEIVSYSQKGHPADPWSLHDMLKNADRVLATMQAGNADSAAVTEIEAQRAAIREALSAFNDGKGDDKPLADAYVRLLGSELTGRPVLVGTASVESSEKLSAALSRKHNIEHEVLNAKNHAREAEIVAKAGQQQEVLRGREKQIHGRVTIATNMAGRGTDIVLGPGVARIGGLHVVGTERHESRRIDNQLRGRCGRQGDPGSSRFFLSMDDELLRLFMGEWVLRMLNLLGFQEGMAIEDKRLNKGIENAQKKVEERNFGIRKNLLDYDEVMDHQRKTFYTMRQKVVEGTGLSALIWEMIDESVADAVNRYYDRLYPAQCVVEWVQQHLGAHIDAEKLDTTNFGALEDTVRESASYEVRSAVQRTFGEYVDADLQPDDWDVRGLVQWAEQYGLHLTQNQVRESDPHDLQEQIVAAAEKTVADMDLRPLEPYVDPLFGRARLVRWAREKFDVEVALDDLQKATPEDAEKIIRDRMRAQYRQREIEYPVNAALDHYISRAGQNANLVYQGLANWANRKFGIGLTWEHFNGKQPRELFEELSAMNAKFMQPENIDAEIEKALAEHPGEAIVEWAKQRFGAVLESHPVDPKAGDLREQLRTCYYQMLRYELTQLERLVVLQTLDAVWKDHMYAMGLLRDAIGFRGMAEKDPKIEFKREGTRLFNEMLSNVRERVTDLIFKVQLRTPPPEGPAPAAAPAGPSAPAAVADESGMAYRNVQTRHADATGVAYATAEQERRSPQGQPGVNEPPPEDVRIEPIKRDQPKVGRNDPCPCGSGKKFKQCHGKGAA